MVKCEYCGEEIVHDIPVDEDDYDIEEYVGEALYDHSGNCKFQDLIWIKGWVGGQKTLAEQIASLDSVVNTLKQYQTDGWELKHETDNGYIFVGRKLSPAS